MGADGLAFWLAREVNVLGSFFGFVEQFNGIGVIVDTYDNDGSGTIFFFLPSLFLFSFFFFFPLIIFLYFYRTGQHPSVALLQNDGTKKYEHSHHGGEHHASSMELG